MSEPTGVVMYTPDNGSTWLPIIPGLPGPRGYSVLSGSGAPSAGLGVDGDRYIDTDVHDMYYKSGGSWALETSLIGTGEQGDPGEGVPAAGTAGQILEKIDGTDYNTQWADPAVALPVGGTTDQVLAKQSATDGDADWVDPAVALPVGGTTGQILEKQSATDGDADWADASGGSLPTGGTSGQILTKQSATEGDADWESLLQSAYVSDLGAVTADTLVTVTHNLGTMDVLIQVIEKDSAAPGAAAGQLVDPFITVIDANSVGLTFAENAVANLYRVAVTKGGVIGAGATFYAYQPAAAPVTESLATGAASGSAYAAMTSTLYTVSQTPTTIQTVVWKGAHTADTYELKIDGVSQGTQVATGADEDLTWTGLDYDVPLSAQPEFEFTGTASRQFRYNTTAGPLQVGTLIWGDWQEASSNTIPMDVTHLPYVLTEVLGGGGSGTATPDDSSLVIASRMFG